MMPSMVCQNGAEIVFSGPDVPGEGEHKVMDMIREQRRQEEEKQQYLPGAHSIQYIQPVE